MAEGEFESIINDIEKEIECGICLQQIKSAKLLNCLHTFCENCLDRITKRGFISCPYCHATTELPEDGVKGLSPNFFFNRIADIVNTKTGSKPTKGSICGNCDREQTLQCYCDDCKHFLCESCTAGHKMMKFLSGHHIVDLTKISSKDFQIFFAKPGECKKHIKEELKLFCEDCKQSICITCNLVEHRNHKCLYLQEAAAMQTEYLKQIMEKAEENKFQLNKMMQDLKQKSLRVQRNAEQTIVVLKASTEKLMQMIRDHFETVQCDIEKEVKNNLESISEKESEISANISKVNKFLKFAKDVLSRDCPTEIVELEDILNKRFSELEIEGTTAGQANSNCIHISYKLNDKVIDALQAIGRVQRSSTQPEKCTFEGDCCGAVDQEFSFFVVTRNENGEIVHSEDDYVSVELSEKAKGTPIKAAIPVSIEGNGKGKYGVSFVPRSTGEYLMNVSVNGQNIYCNKLLTVQTKQRRACDLSSKPPCPKKNKSLMRDRTTPRCLSKCSKNIVQAWPAKTDKTEEKCTLCFDKLKNPATLDKCGHTFCKDCIEQAFSHRKACPTCGTVYGMLTGNQSWGTMNWDFDRHTHLPGYERYGTIRIIYYFSDRKQGYLKPSPGQRYYGTSRTAYLPDCPEGREVLQLLSRAFNAQLTFTTGIRNAVTWNNVHHKTNIHGGFLGYGYPDPTYLSRVKEELAAKGIV